MAQSSEIFKIIENTPREDWLEKLESNIPALVGKLGIEENTAGVKNLTGQLRELGLNEDEFSQLRRTVISEIAAMIAPPRRVIFRPGKAFDEKDSHVA